ncbi:hypothetical protein [Nonomuraea sp. NPDC050310]|uniref:hypothetical protein n=1 Tax=Nonomuraea sp. NPDC050310 TaxID=3154935 RepID=UPI003410BCA9
MRRSIRGSRVLAQPYRDLVWLAYLVLPAGAGEERRLVLAHRLAAAALTRRGRPTDPVELRRVFLRRVLPGRTPWGRLGGRAARWRAWWWRAVPGAGRLAAVEAVPALTADPGRALTGNPGPSLTGNSGSALTGNAGPAPSLDAVEFTRRLQALSPAGRAAYALRRLEGRPAEEVVSILDGAGADDPAAALAEAEALEEGRPAYDPTLARLYGRPARVPVKAAAGLTVCALAAVVVVPDLTAERPGIAGTPQQAGPRLIIASPGAWRAGTDLDLTTWPARGGLTGDRALTGRALARWPGGDTALLYAGEVAGSRVVLLRRPGQVARYTERGERRELEVFPEPRTKPDGASPLELAGGHYLLPPWVREVSTAPLTGSAPRWRAVAVSDGVTAAVPPARKGACWQGPVVRLRAPEIAHGRPYTMLDFGALTLANAFYQPPPPAEINRFGPYELDEAAGGFTAWKGLGCAVERPEGEIQSAMAWEFWAGRLPEGVAGRWICLRLADASGGSTVRGVLLAGRRASVTPARPGSWDCSRLRRDVVAGVWWKAPSGKRYYVAAGSRRVTRISLDGRSVAGRDASGRELPERPELSARNELGEPVTVLR